MRHIFDPGRPNEFSIVQLKMSPISMRDTILSSFSKGKVKVCLFYACGEGIK